jgi:hypothetical protein
MDLLRTFSSRVDQISPSLCLLLVLKGRHISYYQISDADFYRWIFYSAVNSITPLIVLNLGFQTNSWKISLRQLFYTIPTTLVSIPITYVTKRAPLKYSN